MRQIETHVPDGDIRHKMTSNIQKAVHIYTIVIANNVNIIPIIHIYIYIT